MFGAFRGWQWQKPRDYFCLSNFPNKWLLRLFISGGVRGIVKLLHFTPASAGQSIFPVSSLQIGLLAVSGVDDA
jgi:hypothetical protein